MQVSIEWDDGTLLMMVPFEEGQEPDYGPLPALIGAGELRTMRGGQDAYVREPVRNKHEGLLPSFLRWFDGGSRIEYTLTGSHSTEELVAMAESIPV